MAFKILSKTNLSLLLLLIIASVGLSFLLMRPATAPVQGSYVSIRGKQVAVEIADTPAKQAQGLSNHPPLAENQGMLFIFSDRQSRTFWMKDMLYPLDIIWIDGNKIIKISNDLPAEGATPSRTYSSDAPADHVLEVNAGWADRTKVQAGDTIEYHL